VSGFQLRMLRVGIKSCGILLVAILALPQQLHAAEQWTCTVEDFTTFAKEDTEFVAKNLDKVFDIRVDGQDVIVKHESPHFESNEKALKLFSEAAFVRYYQNQPSVGAETLSLPSRPWQELSESGHFNATLTYQSDIFANSWLLKCLPKVSS
jgi:hypothetical protein